MTDKGVLFIAKYMMSFVNNFANNYIVKNIGLIRASIEGYFEVAKFLIEKGANVNIKDQFDVSALFFAVENAHLKIVELLVENGAKVRGDRSRMDTTTLICASRQGNLEIVKYLVEHGADINEADRLGSTALMESSSLEISKYLISQGTDVNVRNLINLCIRIDIVVF